MHDYLYTEDIISSNSYSNLPKERPRQNKFYPYVYDNKYNFYNKNTIKMKSEKKVLVNNIKTLIEDNININHNTIETFEDKQFIRKKYLHQKINSKFNSNTINKDENIKLTISHSPLIFYTETNIENKNIHSYNSHNKRVKENFSYINTLNNNNVYTELVSENRINYKEDKIILGDLLNFVDDIKLVDKETDTIHKDEEVFLTKLDKENNLDEDKDFVLHHEKLILPIRKILNKHRAGNSNSKEKYEEKVILSTNDITNRKIQTYTDKIKTNNFNNKTLTNSRQKNLHHLNKNNFRNKLINNIITLDNREIVEKEYLNYLIKTKDNKNFINQISTFAQKFNRELGKVNHSYGGVDAHIKFADNPLLNNFYKFIPKFDTYKNLKMIESKNTHKYKFKLAPLQNNKKFEKIDNFSNKMYYKYK